MTPTTLDYLSSYRDGVDQLEFFIDQFGDAGQKRPVLYFPGNADADPTAGAGTYANGTNDFYGNQTSGVQLLP
jgi:hypothetical protein